MIRFGGGAEVRSLYGSRLSDLVAHICGELFGFKCERLGSTSTINGENVGYIT